MAATAPAPAVTRGPQPVSVATQPVSTHPTPPPGKPQPPSTTKTTAPPKAQPRPNTNAASPNWLAPMTGQQIRDTAVKTIGAAYKPLFTDLNNQQVQAQAIDDKRAADNMTYQNWLKTQGAALQESNLQANKALTDAYTQINGQLMQSRVAPSDPNATAAGAGTNAGWLANTINQGNAQVANTQHTGLGLAAGNTNMLDATVANNSNYQAAARAGQVAAFQKVTDTLSGARTKLGLTKAGDTAKEIARLQGVEINKAQSNRNFAALASKINLAGQVAANTAAYHTGVLANQAQRNANTLTVAQQHQRNADRLYQLDVLKFGQAKAQDNYLRTHGLGKYRVIAPKGVSGAMTSSQSLKAYGEIEQLRGEINNVMKLAGVSREKAYHLIMNGTPFSYQSGAQRTSTSSSNKGTTSQHQTTPYSTYRPKQPSEAAYLNAAYNLDGQGSINTNDLKALNTLGLYGVRARYQVTPAQASLIASASASAIGNGTYAQNHPGSAGSGRT